MTTAVPATTPLTTPTPLDSLQSMLGQQAANLKALRNAMTPARPKRGSPDRSIRETYEKVIGRAIEDIFEQPLIERAEAIHDVLVNTIDFVNGIESDPDPLTVNSAINQTQTYVQVATPLIDDVASVVDTELKVARGLLAAASINQVPGELATLKEKVMAFEAGLKGAAALLPGLLKTLTRKPDAPSQVSATAQNGWGTVTWTAPQTAPASRIVEYVVTAKGPTRGQVVVGADARTAIFDHLEGGAYSFTVAARNTFGQGAAAATGPVTVLSAPGKPERFIVTAGTEQATLHWKAPISDGGSQVTGYTITYFEESSPARATMLSAGPNATQTTIQPLSSGRSYVFQVAAMNDVGVGQPAIGNVSIKQDYTDYLRPQDLVRDSEAVATAPHLSDQQMIEHLRGVGKAFERFSREDLSLTDDQFEMLTANWGKALERLASARPGGAAGVMSRSEVAAALQIQQMLNKGYEYVAGNYNASRPFDFGDLL